MAVDLHAREGGVAATGWLEHWRLRAIERLAERLERGRLDLNFPDGRRRRIEAPTPGPGAELTLRRGRVFDRYLRDGAMGFAESYIEGDWESADLASLLELLDRNHEAWSARYQGSLLSRLWRRWQHLRNANSRRGAERNIHAHYDLGNAFFGAWLDPTMTYSSALFAEGANDLESAQRAKYRRLCRLLDLRPGHRLLEIGSGWGGFALTAAAEFGAEVTSITISQAQLEHARARVAEAGLEDRVEIRYQDYRDLSGRFDRIASIEMVEAVGAAYWPTYFGKIRDCLRPDGIAALQVITIADRFFDAYRKSSDFIQHYIFPGGMLPSPAALGEEARRAGLERTAWHGFGEDYARTLALWRERFEAAWHDIAAQGFDDRFRRIWRYYLAYCEAGFRTGSIDVVQLALRPRPGVADGAG